MSFASEVVSQMQCKGSCLLRFLQVVNLKFL